MSYAPTYAAQQRDPRKHLLGIGAVVLFHVLLVYALANGLARKVVDIVKAPLTVNVIEEIKPVPPPPPPPKQAYVPPKSSTPPPFVPPVEVPVPTTAPAPVITTSRTPVESAPVAPPAPAAPPVVNAAVACPNYNTVRSNVPYPRQAERLGLSGDVVVEFTLSGAGQIRDVTVVRTSHNLFTQAATHAVSQLQCVGQGHDVRVRVPFGFRLDS